MCCPVFSVHLRPLVYLCLRSLRCQRPPFIRWRAVLAILALSRAVVYLESRPCFALIQPFAPQFCAYLVSPSIANFESPYALRGWFPVCFLVPWRIASSSPNDPAVPPGTRKSYFIGHRCLIVLRFQLSLGPCRYLCMNLRCLSVPRVCRVVAPGGFLRSVNVPKACGFAGCIHHDVVSLVPYSHYWVPFGCTDSVPPTLWL